MPSSKDPSTVVSGSGRARIDSITASALAFDPSLSGNSALLTSINNAIHRDLAILTQTATIVAGGGGDASTIIDANTIPLFVGESGAQASEVFKVVRPGNNDSIDDGTGDDIVEVVSITGATLGTGFFFGGNVTLNFGDAVPAGVSYRIIYAVRQDVSTLGSEAISFSQLKRSQATEELIARQGLDSRYRLSTDAGPAAVLDTAGAGGAILRDGIALTVAVSDALFDDPIAAAFKMIPGAGSPNGYVSGLVLGSGFVSQVGNRFLDDANEAGPMTSAGAFGTIWPHNLAGAITDQKTRVDTGVTGLLNPSGGNVDVLQLGVGQFWFEPGGASAVNVGFDFVEITRAGGALEHYVIDLLDTGNERRCSVVDLAGDAPSFPVDEAVTVRWVTTMFWQGPARAVQEGILGSNVSNNGLGGLVHFPPPVLRTTDTDASASGQFAIFGAEAHQEDRFALVWVGFSDDAATAGTSGIAAGNALGFGGLQGDGGLRTSGHSQLGLGKKKSQDIIVAAASPTVQWNLNQFPYLRLRWTFDGGALTIDPPTPAGFVAQHGDEILIVAEFEAGAVSSGSIVWPTTGGPPNRFIFSSAGDAQPTQGDGSRTVWRGVYNLDINSTTDGFLMTKTSFPLGGVIG